MFTKNLSKSFDEKKAFHEWMHVCMIMLKKHKKHGEVRFNMMESRVKSSQGKNYGFTSICNKVLKKFPALSTPSKRHKFARLLLVQ